MRTPKQNAELENVLNFLLQQGRKNNMQMFSIAHLRQIINQGLMRNEKEEIYLRLEPNGNVMWTIDKELASQWEHAQAEDTIRFLEGGLSYSAQLRQMNCYLVEAVKTDA